MPNVEAEVYLFKIAMERERNPQHAGLEEEEADDADVSDRSEFVELETGRHQRLEQGAFDRVVEHHEMTPFRSEEDSLLPIRCGVHQPNDAAEFMRA